MEKTELTKAEVETLQQLKELLQNIPKKKTLHENILKMLSHYTEDTTK